MKNGGELFPRFSQGNVKRRVHGGERTISYAEVPLSPLPLYSPWLSVKKEKRYLFSFFKKPLLLTVGEQPRMEEEPEGEENFGV